MAGPDVTGGAKRASGARTNRLPEPNKTQDAMDFESALVFRRWQRGEPVEDIAVDMGLSRSVAYKRLNDLIKGRIDLDRRAIRQVSYARLEADYFRLTRAIEDDGKDGDPMPVADLAKLITERRHLVNSIVTLMGARAPDAERDEDADLSDDESWS